MLDTKNLLAFMLFLVIPNCFISSMEDPEFDQAEKATSSIGVFDSDYYHNVLDTLMTHIFDQRYEESKSLLNSYLELNGKTETNKLLLTYHTAFCSTPLKLADTIARSTQNKQILKLLKSFKSTKSMPQNQIINEIERLQISASHLPTNSFTYRISNLIESSPGLTNTETLTNCIMQSDVNMLIQIIKNNYKDNKIDQIIDMINLETGHTPLTLATILGSNNEINKQIILLLLLNGADISRSNEQNQTALEIAQESDDNEMLSLFNVFINLSPSGEDKKIAINFDICHCLHSGLTTFALGILNACAYKFESSSCEVLNLQHSKLNHLPLTIAVKKQNKQIVVQLIQMGADPRMKNHKDRSAFEIAKKKNDKLNSKKSFKILQFLRS